MLWIDDEIRPDDAIVQLLRTESFEVDVATTAREGLSRAATVRYAAVLLDLRLPDMYGQTVLARLTADDSAVPVLVMTGCYAEPEQEELALRTGAAAFLSKLASHHELAQALRAAIGAVRELHRGRGGHPRPAPWWNGAGQALMLSGEHEPGIVAASQSMRDVLNWVTRVAGSPVTVLLTGETGTGKGLLARAIHRASDRCTQTFMAANCGSFVEGLLESELFGHCRGAFTGAQHDRVGLLEGAHRGTVFLDEISELSPAAQTRLLRFLDDGEFRRVGETRARRADVRVIAATHDPLEDMVARGRFRSDLFYRVAVARCHVPPLRERPEDLAALTAFWLRRPKRVGSRVVTAVTPEALDRLRRHGWPGNVRELHNVLERAVLHTSGDRLTAADITAALATTPSTIPSQANRKQRQEVARGAVAALEAHQGNHNRAARALGINRTTLWRRLRGLSDRVGPGQG